MPVMNVTLPQTTQYAYVHVNFMLYKQSIIYIKQVEVSAAAIAHSCVSMMNGTGLPFLSRLHTTALQLIRALGQNGLHLLQAKLCNLLKNLLFCSSLSPPMSCVGHSYSCVVLHGTLLL